MKEISISTKKELDIYMNPQRQRLLKCMEIRGVPMTSKQLADCLEISSSSVTFHIKKLLELGVIELDHTEMIHGICAKYYKRIPARVNLEGGKKDDLKLEKEVLLDCMMNETWGGFKEYLEQAEEEEEKVRGDMRNGILYLTPEDARELMNYICKFQEAHSVPKEDTEAWEVTLVAYPQSKW